MADSQRSVVLSRLCRTGPRHSSLSAEFADSRAKTEVRQRTAGEL